MFKPSEDPIPHQFPVLSLPHRPFSSNPSFRPAPKKNQDTDQFLAYARQQKYHFAAYLCYGLPGKLGGFLLSRLRRSSCLFDAILSEPLGL